MKKKKSILFIIFSIGNGGSGRALLNILNGTELNNYRKVLYLYNNIDKNSFEDLIKIPHTKYSNNNNNVPFPFINRLITLYKIINKEKISVIFAFSSQGALLATTLKLLGFYNKITIIVRLGSVFNQMFFNPGGSAIKRKIWEKITLFFTYRFVNKIVCTTNYMKDELISLSNKLESKIIVIKNYIDKKFVEDRIDESIDVPDKYFISVGRLEEEKNYQGIIEAFNSIKDTFNQNLIILGDGSLRSELLEAISKYNLNNRVKLLGFVNNPYKYIAKADCLILFSNFEGLPNVIIEAFICKTPVIVSNYPGVNDIITSGKNGMVVEAGNTYRLATAMETLISDARLRERFVKNGYEKSFDFTSSISKYEMLIKSYSGS